MTEHIAALVAQMAKLFRDIAKGSIPQHVAAMVLDSLHNDTPMPLEQVPPKEWAKVSDADGSELFTALANLFDDVTNQQIDVRMAGNFIHAIHDHLESARELLLAMPVLQLGLSESSVQFCHVCKISTVGELTAINIQDLLSLRVRHKASYAVMQNIQVALQKLPLCPRLSA
ncbi:MAG: hypothetical protein ABIP54_01015 [Candidatus Andersenbacteria bacterium]